MAVSVTSPQPESRISHTSDSNIQPFLQANFDPVDYLNNALPSLSTGTRSTISSRSASLPELSTQLQTLLSQLNAQTSRLSNTLTQLTDEIIRSGARLAYEVDVLRGETSSLTDSLENGLKKDIELFVPRSEQSGDTGTIDADAFKSNDAPFLSELQTLAAARSNLDQVIHTFGEAMAWPFAPSDLSKPPSLISVSAAAGSEDRVLEEKAAQYNQALQNEISALLSSGEISAAEQRLIDLRRLAEVFKGTAEEKARFKIVDGLKTLVEEKVKVAQAGRGVRRTTGEPARGVDMRYGDLGGNTGGREGGYGFLQNLKKLGGDVYLE